MYTDHHHDCFCCRSRGKHNRLNDERVGEGEGDSIYFDSYTFFFCSSYVCIATAATNVTHVVWNPSVSHRKGCASENHTQTHVRLMFFIIDVRLLQIRIITASNRVVHSTRTEREMLSVEIKKKKRNTCVYRERAIQLPLLHTFKDSRTYRWRSIFRVFFLLLFFFFYCLPNLITDRLWDTRKKKQTHTHSHAFKCTYVKREDCWPAARLWTLFTLMLLAKRGAAALLILFKVFRSHFGTIGSHELFKFNWCPIRLFLWNFY